MEIIKAIAKRGLELKGAIYEAKSETALILLTGMCSNVFQNDLLDSTGKLLSKNGITTIIAFMEQLNKWTKNPEKNQVIEVEGASHIFYNMQEIYAKTLLKCIREHFKG